jgi:hypothetical protein
MMAYTALVFTILFVLFLFLIDRKRNMRVSAALWIPVDMDDLLCGKTHFFWISPTSAQTLDTVSFMEGSPVDRNILSFLIIISIYVLLKRKIKWGSIFKNNWLIALWFLYCWDEYILV